MSDIETPPEMDTALAIMRSRLLSWVDYHDHLPDFIKPVAKDIMGKQFDAMMAAVGALEVAVGRSEIDIRQEVRKEWSDILPLLDTVTIGEESYFECVERLIGKPTD